MTILTKIDPTKIKKILTIKKYKPEDRDREINEAIKQGWILISISDLQESFQVADHMEKGICYIAVVARIQ